MNFAISKPVDILERIFDLAVGSFLLFAAISKSAMLVSPKWVFLNTGTEYQINLFLVFFEIFLAAILIGGIWQTQKRLFFSGLFLTFSYYQMKLVFDDIHTCSCLGVVQVAPRVMLIIDLVIANVFFLFYFLSNASSPAANNTRTNWSVSTGTMAVAVFVASFVMFGNDLQNSVTKNHQAGFDIANSTDDEFRIIKPGQLVGQKFPLNGMLHDSQKLPRSSVVVLANHSCQTCKKLLDSVPDQQADKFVVIYLDQLPEESTLDQRFAHVNVKTGPTWICNSPTILRVVDGVVEEVGDRKNFHLFIEKES